MRHDRTDGDLKVPKDFWVQYPNYANPPTLTMAVTAYIKRLKRAAQTILASDLALDGPHQGIPLGTVTSDTAAIADRHLHSPELAQEYLRGIYPKLRRHYQWFRSSQRGQIAEWGRQATSRTEAFRWRGRSATHVLTSGLDDYPRARPPHVGELHLDLASWMAFFSRTMSEIAEYLDEEEDLEEYQHAYKAQVANIDGMVAAIYGAAYD